MSKKPSSIESTLSTVDQQRAQRDLQQEEDVSGGSEVSRHAVVVTVVTGRWLVG